MKQNRTIQKPSPSPAVRVGRLDTLAGIRVEIGKLYRQARSTAGRNVDPKDAGRLAYILNTLASHIESQELEKRIKAIEDRLG